MSNFGADINAIDSQGQSVLALASDCAYFQIVHYLLNCGADYNQPARKDLTFVSSLKQKLPEYYRNGRNNEEQWCRAVWEWMISHQANPSTAEWDGEKWVFPAPVPNDSES